MVNDQNSHRPARATLLTIFLVVLVDLMGFGIILPLLPFFASQFQSGPVAIGALYAIYSLAQLVFSPIWGALSDRIGRRPVMLISTLGSSVSYVLFVFSGSFAALFATRLLAGIMGGNIAAAQSYISDVTAPEDRAKGMGLIGAAFGIGFALGPLVASGLMYAAPHAGGWAANNAYAAPGIAAALLSGASFILVLFKLPETVDKNRVSVSAPQRRSVFGKAFWRAASGSAGHRRLPALLGCVLLLSVGQSSLYSAFPLFCREAAGLTPPQIGLEFGIMGLIAILIQGGMIRRLVASFGEIPLFFVGSALMTAGLAAIPLTSSFGPLTLVLAVMAAGGSLNGPVLFSLVSKEAPEGETGATMGLSQSSAGMGRVLGPIWGGALYAKAFFLPFILTAGLVALTIPAARYLARARKPA